eukprot:CAMPEP_0206600768 /NCGR_PEP_ID=MMETSP0325_2-20121206/46065_1 /ASSEMBLY_ACC=CAM_ASM_000347 /TAXON_ID=2866 /ORGANISM="Crypthecodinium cohnii, Strain Seligo" /LENGTH=129 /DNA_ID=CAMNT_0054112281 /DNA_START=289 /DNA_END=678 /DNA_ORIENTATION=+
MPRKLLARRRPDRGGSCLIYVAFGPLETASHQQLSSSLLSQHRNGSSPPLHLVRPVAKGTDSGSDGKLKVGEANGRDADGAAPALVRSLDCQHSGAVTREVSVPPLQELHRACRLHPPFCSGLRCRLIV